MLEKEVHGLSMNEYIQDQKEAVEHHLMAVLECTTQSPLHADACGFFDMINNKLLDNKLADASDMILWTNKGEFKNEILAKTFISDHRFKPYLIFSIVLSSILVMEKKTLFKVLIHEIAHCIQHMQGESVIPHGSSFRKTIRQMAKKMKCDTNKVLQRHLAEQGCDVDAIFVEIISEL